MAEPYNVPGISDVDDDEFVKNSVIDTGLYFRRLKKCWEIWYVDQKTQEKSMVGWSDESQGREHAIGLWTEFLYLSKNRITSMKEICEPGELQ